MLVQTINVSSEDIGMEFGMGKCAMLVIQKGKNVKSPGIELPDGKVIKLLHEGESYKYHEILAADRFLGEEMESKLNYGNLVQGNNAWTVTLLRYLWSVY